MNSALPAGRVTIFGTVIFAPLLEASWFAKTAATAGRPLVVTGVFVLTRPSDTWIGTGCVSLSGQANAWKR